MADPLIVWEDECLALWSNGKLCVYKQEMGHDHLIDSLSPQDVRSLYDALTKFYKENASV